ncbi:MAG: coenzyme F420-0:L-glutamate ligase [Candidatus Bathyarchaeia archaeon]
MGALPDYIGVTAFGVKMGVILEGDDIVEETYKSVAQCHADGLISDGDILCIKESVVARAQNNYVSKEEIAKDVREKLGLTESSNLGILYPIVSRNRFVPILEGLVKAVPKGKITIQFSYPRDCVGNQIAPENLHQTRGIDLNSEKIVYTDPNSCNFNHPSTGVNYLELYAKIAKAEGVTSEIYLSNDPYQLINHKVDGIIVSCIHDADEMLQKIKEKFENSITLKDICNNPRNLAWSEWGVLGSNMHSDKELKLAPREASKVAQKLQLKVKEQLGKTVEVIIFGDGAYMDPSTKIYELADPVCSFGCTKGLVKLRTGIKYKYFVGKLSSQGKTKKEIESIIEQEKQKTHELDDISMEGTTPRKLHDVVGSLADLLTGSADAGTPLVVVKSLLK